MESSNGSDSVWIMEPPDLRVRGVSRRLEENAPRFPEHKVREGSQSHRGTLRSRDGGLTGHDSHG